jgi:exodeoxyribonuclease VII small subunit
MFFIVKRNSSPHECSSKRLATMDPMNVETKPISLTLEETMDRLDDLTQALAANLPLNEALNLYQEAMQHVQHAQTLLNKADATLRILEQGQLNPFDLGS